MHRVWGSDATVGTTDEAAVQKLTYDDIKSIVGL